MTEVLSHRLVKRLIRDEEIPARSAVVDPEIVQAVYRYGAPVGSTIERFDRQGRCMERARTLIARHEELDHSFPSGMVILADQLTGGKGRFQRYWHAPRGGLWMTMVVVNTLLLENMHLYSLAAGLACCEAVRHYQVDAHIKWVNDAHVRGRKIAGVLIETMIGPRFGEEYVLIGVGVNVNNERFPDDLSSSATSLKAELGRHVDLDSFAARLLAKFSWSLGLVCYEEARQLAEGGGAEEGTSRRHLLLDQWRHLSDTIGRRVLYGYDVQKNPQYRADVLDLDSSGGLILRVHGDGATVVERSGELVYLD